MIQAHMFSVFHPFAESCLSLLFFWSLKYRGTLRNYHTHTHHVYIIIYRYCIIYTVNIHQCCTCLVGKNHPLSFVKKIPPLLPSSKALVAATAAVGSNDCQGSWTLHPRRRRARGWNVGGWRLGPRCVCFLLFVGWWPSWRVSVSFLGAGSWHLFFVGNGEVFVFVFFLVRI